MKKIWKYSLEVKDRQDIKMPKGSRILTVQTQAGDTPFIWVLVDPEEKETETRNIETFGTGHEINEGMGTMREYVGTYQIQGGVLVFHVFEYNGV